MGVKRGQAGISFFSSHDDIVGAREGGAEVRRAAAGRQRADGGGRPPYQPVTAVTGGDQWSRRIGRFWSTILRPVLVAFWFAYGAREPHTHLKQLSNGSKMLIFDPF